VVRSKGTGRTFAWNAEFFGVRMCRSLPQTGARRNGGFDERFFAYLEDVDLGLRLQAAGNHGYYIPGAKVYHHGAATSGGNSRSWPFIANPEFAASVA